MLKLGLGFFLSLPCFAQATVLRTNCPKNLVAGTIVVAQSVTNVANYPVVILACYTLDQTAFSIDNSTTPPTIRITSIGISNESSNEVPSGSVDGSNAVFTLANAPIVGSVKLYRNGLKMSPNFDYTISGVTITFIFIPQANDILNADYRY